MPWVRVPFFGYKANRLTALPYSDTITFVTAIVTIVVSILGGQVINSRYTGNMSTTITDHKTYTVSADALFAAAITAVTNLEGNIQSQDKDSGEIVVKFHKTVLGKVLGDRTWFELTIKPTNEGSSLDVTAYPLNAVGQKLMFGARKGVTRTVLNWIYAHIDNNLAKAAA